MAIWRQLKQSQMKALSTHLKRSYFQIHIPYGMNITSSMPKVTDCNFPRLPHQKRQFEIPSTNLRFYAAPAQYMQKKEEKDGVRLNEQITADVVRVVTEEGHTIMPKQNALGLAKSQNLDLVEVQRSANPPVCKIMDYNRETFQKAMKEKERVKEKVGSKLKTGDCKEIRFAGKITQKDLQIKADMVKRLMDKGYRVKCLAVGKTIKQTGSAEDSKNLLSRFLSMIEDISVIESDSRMTVKKDQTQASEKDQTQAVEKDQTHVIVRHIKYGPLKKGLGKNTGKTDKSPPIVNTQAETKNLSESNSISSSVVPEQKTSSGVTENRYLQNSRDNRSQQKTSSGVTENRYLQNSRDNRSQQKTSSGVTENRYLQNSRDNRSQQKTSSGVTENRYLQNSRDNRSEPYNSTDGRSSNPSFQQNPRSVSPRQADNNNNVGEESKQTVVNRYKVRNPSESRRDPRPNSPPYPNSRINRDQAVVDKDQQGKWGVFSGDGSNRLPGRNSSP